jgi:uncharacterized protein
VTSDQSENVSLWVSDSIGKVSGILRIPDDAGMLLVLAHGAGAGMRHRFLEALSNDLAKERVATFRYQFPYMERGFGRPDPAAVLIRTVQAAVSFARSRSDLPLLAGGKSLGGRMTSSAASEGKIDDVHGLVFYGFPLHAPAKPGVERAQHLECVKVPMLFLQGTRDAFARQDLLSQVLASLADLATLIEIDDADHSFHVPKRSGANDSEVVGRLARSTREWAERLRVLSDHG